MLGRCLTPPQARLRAMIALERQFEIVKDRMAIEHGRLLEFSTDTEIGDLGLVELGEIVDAVEHDIAAVRPGLAGDDVHHRGLAGAVRADDGAHLAGLDGEGQIVERLEAVERHVDAVEIEKRGGECFHPHSAGSGSLTPSSAAAETRARRSAVQWCRVPTTPRGNSNVTPMNRLPSMNR